MSRPVRVRFAPSPTGPLHLGGVRTALYNYLFARKNGGKFILRIEDTDQTRFVPGAEEYIMNSLKWAGMELDEGIIEGGEFGPYRQSDRKHLYKKYVDQLIESGHAYYAFDTPEELDEMRERLKSQGVPNPAYNHVTRQYMKNSISLPADEVKRRLEENQAYVVRIKVSRNEEIRFHDIIRGWVIFNSSQIDDKVIFKSDGMPTYHMANIVDDYLMKITHVIRGEEWLPSTPVHVLLYKFLGWEDMMPEFAHLPLILKPDGNGKLSKRDGDRLGFPVFPLNWINPETKEESIGFKERGFLPDAFVNILAFLGWNPGGTQELYKKEELIEAFSLERVSKSGAKFDFEKAKWFNQQYIKATPIDNLLESLRDEFISANIHKDDEYLKKYIQLFVDRVTFVKEFISIGYYMFKKPNSYDEVQFNKRWTKENIPATFDNIKTQLSELNDWKSNNIESVIKQVLNDNGCKSGDIMSTFRIMISGEAGGPPLFEMAEMIGKEEVIERMNTAIAYFSK
ncbi:MAG: glutamate--tRNA ligase [Chitinophagales bacterium]|nr:glutamate--tRNA ligase [Chitinophagales bacterium]MCZ2393335.1 glutamate--tRNA ligase [Chitinophagales bacterium]